ALVQVPEDLVRPAGDGPWQQERCEASDRQQGIPTRALDSPVPVPGDSQRRSPDGDGGWTNRGFHEDGGGREQRRQQVFVTAQRLIVLSQQSHRPEKQDDGEEVRAKIVQSPVVVVVRLAAEQLPRA